MLEPALPWLSCLGPGVSGLPTYLLKLPDCQIDQSKSPAIQHSPADCLLCFRRLSENSLGYSASGPMDSSSLQICYCIFVSYYILFIFLWYHLSIIVVAVGKICILSIYQSCWIPCPYWMPLPCCMLMSMLQIHVHDACSSLYSMEWDAGDEGMQHGYGHVARTRALSMDMGMQHGQRHAVWTGAWGMDMDMQHGYGHWLLLDRRRQRTTLVSTGFVEELVKVCES
jgi:hypothetical protein